MQKSSSGQNINGISDISDVSSAEFRRIQHPHSEDTEEREARSGQRGRLLTQDLTYTNILLDIFLAVDDYGVNVSSHKRV